MKSLSHFVHITLLAVLLAGTVFSARPVPSAQALGATLIVNTQNDNNPPLDDGYCSLREAIRNANTNALTYDDCLGPGSATEPDTILFAADPSILTYFYLNSDLPQITDPAGLMINGRDVVVIHGRDQYQLFNVRGGALTLASLQLQHGKDAIEGGAVANYDHGTVTVTRSVFYGNHALYGGAIFNDGFSTLIVTNSALLENFAITSGGAVEVEGAATLVNNTFNKNSATKGGNLWMEIALVTLVNNIIANNQGGGDCAAGVAATVQGHHNLIEDAATACGFTNGVNGNVVGVDPVFDPNNFYGIAMLSTSPAIDAGDSFTCAQVPVNNTALNGLPRPQGLRCDIGAYEFPPMLSVGGAGYGTGTLTGNGIACSYVGPVNAGDCSEQFATGTNTSIVAAPTAGSTFLGWLGCNSTSTTNSPGDTCSVTMAANKSVTANFRAPTTEMHVNDVETYVTSNLYIRATTWVLENNNEPVAGVTVTGAFKIGTSTTQSILSCVTASDGSCTISKRISSTADRYTFKILSLSGGGLVYNPSANLVSIVQMCRDVDGLWEPCSY